MWALRFVHAHRYQNSRERSATAIAQEEAGFVAAGLPAVEAANRAACRDGLTIHGTSYNGKFTTANFGNAPHVDTSDDKSAASPIIWYHYGGIAHPPAPDACRSAAGRVRAWFYRMHTRYQLPYQLVFDHTDHAKSRQRCPGN